MLLRKMKMYHAFNQLIYIGATLCKNLPYY